MKTPCDYCGFENDENARRCGLCRRSPRTPIRVQNTKPQPIKVRKSGFPLYTKTSVLNVFGTHMRSNGLDDRIVESGTGVPTVKLTLPSTDVHVKQ